MTQQTHDTYTADALDADVKKYLELDERRKDIEAEQAVIKARIRSLGVGHHDAPCGVGVTISVNRRFDPKTAEQVLPPELLALCRAEVIDSKKAKQALPPAIYDSCMKVVGDPRVVIS